MFLSNFSFAELSKLSENIQIGKIQMFVCRSWLQMERSCTEFLGRVRVHLRTAAPGSEGG